MPTKASVKPTQTPGVKISDVVYLTLKRWPWIILSVVVCCGLAVLYLMRTPNVYTRTASIVIKDDSKGKSGSSEMDAFADMGLIKTHSNISDEINKILSPDVMREVVKRQNFDVSYYHRGRFKNDLLYGAQVPIKVTFPDIMEKAAVSADISVNAKGQYTVSDLKYNGQDVSYDHKPLMLGDTLRTNSGLMVVNSTPYLRKGETADVLVVRTPLKSAIGAFSGKLNVALKTEKGNTINITATDLSTERAEDLINAVISVYNEKWMENRNQISVSTSNFINERLGVIEGELGNVDQDISSYQSEHLIPNVQQAASMYMTENQQTSAQILELNNQLQMTRYMRGYLTNEANKTQPLPVNSGINNGAIEGQIAQYNATMIERNQLADNSSDTHPVVMGLDAQLAAQRSAIISTIDNQIVALNTQIKGFQSSKNRATAQLAANPNQAKYLLSVERQQKVKESLYLYLLQKREENELSQAFTAYNTQVIMLPTGADFPVAPDRNKILLMAFAIGLIIPFGVSYVLEASNTKVRGRKDVENLNVPFLGEIPSFPHKKEEEVGENGKTVNVVVKHGKRDSINEAFRVLRTNIGFMSTKEEGCTVIMVTSFNPGSGKTFIAMNLGVSLAIKGMKVLVIDGDLRRASASSYVDSPEKGLSNYLVGEDKDLESLIVSDTIVKGLSVLPVGTVPPNPTELLESKRFSQMLASMRAVYDYILIDCPPIEMMADAQIIEKEADRTIFVVRAGLLERGMLVELEKMNDEKKFKNLGIVLNDTPVDKSRYGYGYGYRYGYTYESNYGSTK